MQLPQTLAMNATHDPSELSATGQAALAYAARGWSVIPVQPRAKRPLVVWREFQQRGPSAQEIRAWFQRWPDANVGIVTGQVSGLVVVDVDPAHGGRDSVRELEGIHGPLPATVECVTGGGGRHLYYRHPGGNVPNRVGIQLGIDVRGDGGYIVAPPSVHPSGKHYFWAAGRSPEESRLAAPPVHFFETDPHSPPHGHTRMHWRHLIQDGVPEGQRNSSIASLTGHLLWRGVDLDVVLEMMLAWNRTHCRPPLPDEEVAQVVQSIARTHERGAG